MEDDRTNSPRVAAVESLILYHDCAQVFVARGEGTVLPFEPIDGSIIALEGESKAPTTVATQQDPGDDGARVVGSAKPGLVGYMTRQLSWRGYVNVFTSKEFAGEGSASTDYVLTNNTGYKLVCRNRIQVSPKSVLPREVHFAMEAGEFATARSAAPSSSPDGADLGTIQLSLTELDPGKFTMTVRSEWSDPQLTVGLNVNEYSSGIVPAYMKMSLLQNRYTGSCRATVYSPSRAVIGFTTLPNIPVETVAKVTLNLAPGVVATAKTKMTDARDVGNTRVQFFTTDLLLENRGEWTAPVSIKTPNYFQDLKVVWVVAGKTTTVLPRVQGKTTPVQILGPKGMASLTLTYRLVSTI